MRFVLIDFMHLAHKTIGMPRLSAFVQQVGGQMVSVDTTIPSITIKNITKYGDYGRKPTGVFFEGGSKFRKEYFAKGYVGRVADATGGEGYKGSRPTDKGGLYAGADLTLQKLHSGKVSVYRQHNFEADDLIINMVYQLKRDYPDALIDVITNDSDLLALVDEKVSVYMRATRQHAEEGSPEFAKYYQVTPNTWTEFLGYSSEYRSYRIPYNSMLLYKLIRGDKSDEYAGACRGYGGVKYSQVMMQMEADGVDFANVFRYNVDFDSVIRPVLEPYFTGVVEVKNRLGKFVPLQDESGEEVTQLAYMKYLFEGIKPKPIDLAVPLQIDMASLQLELHDLRINLKMG